MVYSMREPLVQEYVFQLTMAIRGNNLTMPYQRKQLINWLLKEKKSLQQQNMGYTYRPIIATAGSLSIIN